MVATSRKTLLLSLALIAVAVIVVAKLALSPFWTRYTPDECRHAYAGARTLADTQRVDLMPAFGSDSSRNHHCGEVRAAPGKAIGDSPTSRTRE